MGVKYRMKRVKILKILNHNFQIKFKN
jgi:hypothetical protein